ncbi:MAG: proline dehydrogenase family protein [Cyclobacteriaceae bacterium]|nr:proline dehydrogenase family protein [Cyclobacteriaceae bacterium HetDA_MAG_MS6]
MIKSQKMTFDDTSIAFAAKSNMQLKKSHFVFSTMNYPWMVKLGTIMTTLALKIRLPVKGIIRSTIFEQFCGGESIEDCQKAINHLASFNVKTILDYSVEGQESEESFDRTLREALLVADHAGNDVNIPFCVVKLTGLGSSTIMAKKQSAQQLTSSEEAGFKRFLARADQLAKRCYESGVHFMVDAEESWIQHVIDDMVYNLMEKYNTERAVVFNTYQLYRHEALQNMKEAFAQVTSKGGFFGAKLVRGAYMEKERDRAEERGYMDPIQPNKSSTDRDYNLALDFAVKHIDQFSVLAGTHNEKSSAYMVDLMDDAGIAKDDPRVFFAQLLGMSDNISFTLSKSGYNVAKYVPYGPVEKVLPYLFRRADENTSIAGQSGREFSLIKKEIKRRKVRR